MSDSLLDAAQMDGSEAGTPEARAQDLSVPSKFIDAATGQVRVDALLKSYLELERKLSQRTARPGRDASPEERQRFRTAMGIPQSAEEYQVEARHELCGPDPDINARLHEADFAPDQVQLVYDLAAERLVPIIAEAASQFEASRQLEKLRSQHGGEERFSQLSRQIAAWGKANLPPEVFSALSTTAEGVNAMHGMMGRQEPAVTRQAEQPEPADEEGLRRLMRDPRYWRNREPELIRRVTEGFRRLTGS
ncbi:capsid assembly protein [Roseomonas elaeocarpi]|uniref:Uncharacterized protein n=1 Tax=Roseomonas elaeocarpi TaxID=907779 RepID=A0ABV6JQF4_9PROT